MKINKKQINKKIRIALIAAVICAFAVLALFLYKLTSSPSMEEQKVSLYSYHSKSSVNYEVSLRPNDLFEELNQGEDQVYLTNLVDSIKASYTYQFTGDYQADIKGNYEIVAVLEGYTTDKEQKTSIWKKQFTVVPKTNFNAKDNKITIKRDAVLNIGIYNNFLKKIKDETKVSSDVAVSALMNVNLNAMTDKGLIQDTISSSIVFPFDTYYFKISKQQIDDKPGVIQETKEVPSSGNLYRLIFYIIALVILLIFLIALLMLTSNSITNDPFLKNLKRIFKKYGGRLIAFNTEISIIGDSFLVKSIEDLVRLSDEIGKPIIYRYRKNLREITKFYVLDERCTYYFELNGFTPTNSDHNSNHIWAKVFKQKKDNPENQNM